jgi:hypothetical protein
MPVWIFERMMGTDLTTMWRWLGAANFHFDTAATREILPSARTVEAWLENHRPRPADSA